MKKRLIFTLCALCMLALAACGAKTPGVDEPGAHIANPFVDYDTLDEAFSAAGFDLTAPTSIDGFDAPHIQLMSGKMLQLIFTGGDQRLVIRKAAGHDDISGDYNSYAETKTARVNGADVTLKGTDGKVSTAVWCAGGYSYAVLSDTPMASDIMTDLIAEIA